MADQEFLASFGVEIDETGLLRLQEALTFTQYAPAAGVKMNDNSSSATHVGINNEFLSYWVWPYSSIDP